MNYIKYKWLFLFSLLMLVAGCKASKMKNDESKMKNDESNKLGLILIELTGSGQLVEPSRGKRGREYDKSEFKVIKVINPPMNWSITDSLFLFPDPGKDSVGRTIYVKPEKDRNWRVASESK